MQVVFNGVPCVYPLRFFDDNQLERCYDWKTLAVGHDALQSRLFAFEVGRKIDAEIEFFLHFVQHMVFEKIGQLVDEIVFFSPKQVHGGQFPGFDLIGYRCYVGDGHSIGFWCEDTFSL